MLRWMIYSKDYTGEWWGLIFHQFETQATTCALIAGSLPPSRCRSLFTLATSMILFSSKVFNIFPLIDRMQAIFEEKMVRCLFAYSKIYCRQILPILIRGSKFNIFCYGCLFLSYASDHLEQPLPSIFSLRLYLKLLLKFQSWLVSEPV